MRELIRYVRNAVEFAQLLGKMQSCRVRQLPLSDDLVKDAIGQGRILFLLDGMDEIIDTIQRREVARRIEEFAFSHPRCRILVTSCVVGYREAQLSREFSQFTISPVIASLEALSALYKLLKDHNRNVHEAAEWALRKMSLYIGSQDRSEAMKLFLALARSNNIAQRDIGYVGLRNLLAARHS